jgi:transcriptional regulator with XRE-family HTH domain
MAAAKRAPIELGSTGRVVADNVRRHRTARKLTIAQLSEQLQSAGRYIAEISLGRIEAGTRRVDVDDLVAIAGVLEVPLVDLLLPDGGPADDVEVTTWGSVNRGLARWRMGVAETEAAARVLALAQRTADELVADAKLEADRMLSEARTRADKIDSEYLAMVTKIEYNARARAAALEHAARNLHDRVVGKLESEREHLDSQVQNLKAFEREYRTRLKAYIEINAAHPDAPPAFIEFSRRMIEQLESKHPRMSEPGAE